MRRFRRAALVGIAAMALGSTAQAADPAPVVAAERAFAADGAANGVKASFLRAMADDAIVFAPDPVNAKDLYGARPDGKGVHVLTWRPTYAGLAASGDLGFTTGPFAIDGKPGGYYFTVWAKQPDGSWKWVLDGGSESDASTAPGPNAAVQAMAAGFPSKNAIAKVRALEHELAAGAEHDLWLAYAPRLAPEARVQGSAAAPADSPTAVKRELSTRPKSITFTPLGARTSKAGDLVFTYGDARWSEAGKPARGHYVRLWRNDRDGFRIVFDELLLV